MNRRLCQYTTLHVQRWKFNKSSKRQFSYVSTENAQKLIAKTTKHDNLALLKNLAAQIEVKRYLSDDEDNNSINKEIKKTDLTGKKSAMTNQKDPKSQGDAADVEKSSNDGAGDIKIVIGTKSEEIKAAEEEDVQLPKQRSEHKSENDGDEKGGFWKWLTTKKQVPKKPLTPRELIERHNDPFKRFDEDIERKTRIAEEREQKK